MTLSVSSGFIDVLRDGGAVSNRLFIGSSDYSNRVQSWPKIKRKSDLKSQSMTIKLANHDGGLNTFYEDTYNSVVEIGIDLGVEVAVDSYEYARIYTGDVTNFKYNNRLATVTTKDKLWRLTDSIIGTNETPVSFTNIIPTDIAWDIMTCYGGFDSTESTSNTDIDYTSFLDWASIFSADLIDMSAYYDGDKVLTALSDLAEATRSTIWINEDGKFEFDRFGGVTVASETFVILEREQLDFEVDVTAKDAVNNYGVNYNWDVDSGSFANIDYSVNSDSVSNIGELSENLEVESIWYTNQTNASLIGQREVLLYGRPPKVWQAATGLVGADKTLSQLSRLVNSFYGVTSADVWRITEQQIDLGSGRVDLTFDSAVSLYGFYLDVDSLDQTSRFLF